MQIVGPVEYDYNKRLILLFVIQLSGKHYSGQHYDSHAETECGNSTF